VAGGSDTASVPRQAGPSAGGGDGWAGPSGRVFFEIKINSKMNSA
jgi:hypothetical protein